MDAQWALIQGWLPDRTGRSGRPFADARLMAEGIVSVSVRTAWRDLPPVLGPWQTVRLGIGCSLPMDLGSGAHGGDRAGRPVGPGRCRWTPRSRAHQHATNVTRLTGGWVELHQPGIEPPDHAVGRSRGGCRRSCTYLVNGHGRPLVIAVAPGQARRRCCRCWPSCASPDPLGGRAPGRTRSAATRPTPPAPSTPTLRRRGIRAVIPERAEQAAPRTPRRPRRTTIRPEPRRRGSHQAHLWTAIGVTSRVTVAISLVLLGGHTIMPVGTIPTRSCASSCSTCPGRR